MRIDALDRPNGHRVATNGTGGEPQNDETNRRDAEDNRRISGA